jgi:two-component system chemotaxis response regulator CheB
LEERVALARKLERQAIDGDHRLLAENWSDKVSEFDRELKIIRNAIEQMEHIAFQSDQPARSVTE